MHSSNKSLLPCPDDACGGNADGWGVRDGAAALTVGLIFCALFYHREKCKITLRAGATPTEVGRVETGEAVKYRKFTESYLIVTWKLLEIEIFAT